MLQRSDRLPRNFSYHTASCHWQICLFGFGVYPEFETIVDAMDRKHANPVGPKDRNVIHSGVDSQLGVIIYSRAVSTSAWALAPQVRLLPSLIRKIRL